MFDLFSKRRAVVLVAVGIGCGAPTESEPTVVGQSSEALGSCSSHVIRVVDLAADFRDIWLGRENAETGKQADPDLRVGVHFSTTVDPARVGGEFAPVELDGACGGSIAATLASSVVATNVWGTLSSNSTRPKTPRPYNVYARESVSGIPSVAGPIAAGGEVSLSSFGVNGTALQTFGLVAGGKVTLANGSVAGSVSYGAPSSFPQSVTVSGTKSQQPFDVAASFQNLETLSRLLASEVATGSAQLNAGTLQLTGTVSGRNVFRVSSTTLAQSSNVRITVPAGAGAIIDVTGENVVIENKGFTLQGVTPSTLLWNFAGASLLKVASVGLSGSVLAPQARLAFESGSVNGTVVVRSSASPGSGSFAYAPLNATLLLGNTAPSFVELKPATPLVRGCKYEFLIPVTRRLTAGGACLNSELRVPFRVAANPSTPAMRELANATPDPVTGTLRRFEARSGINTPVAEVWSRYRAATGVGAADLVSLGIAVPSPTRAGAILTAYRQYHLGYPVAGHGYVVSSEAGLFREAVGRIAPSLPSALPTPMSQSSALQRALQHLGIANPPWITNPTANQPPAAVLALKPNRPNPSQADFALVWSFSFAGTGLAEPGSIELNAATGSVLTTLPGTVQAVAALPDGSTYRGQVPNTVDTLYGTGVRHIDVAELLTPSNALVTTLSSGDLVHPNGQMNLAFVPANPALTPFRVIDPTPATPWTATEPIEQAMATAYWGLQRSVSYLRSLEFRPVPGASAWTAIDGTGQQSVNVGWVEAGSANQRPGYVWNLSNATSAIIRLLDGPPGPPAEPATVPHEFAHAFLASLRRQAHLVPDLRHRGESGSIEEGLSDLFAIGSTHLQLPGLPEWSCIQDAVSPNAYVCLRDIADPLRTGHPMFYGGVNYGVYTNVNACPDSDDCFTHRNSTVVSHWGYLLGFGSNAAPRQNPCGLSIHPLETDPDAAMRRVIKLGYLSAGVQPILWAHADEPTFADFRDSTISVARGLAVAGEVPSDTPRKVELAWYAVGLGPPFMTSPTAVAPSDADVTPPDDGASVQPWQGFSWPTLGDGQSATAWDFQIADGPFDPAETHLRHEETNITATVENGTATMSVFDLALPFDSQRRFYWRVRPHTSGPWAGCYPIHSFVGTTRPGSIENIEPFSSLPDGSVRPGLVGLQWDLVEGAQSYKVYASTVDPNCTSGVDVLEAETGNRATNLVLAGFQPEEHYFINVQPIGPRDFAGDLSVGGCFKTEIDTAAMRAPNLVEPVNNAVYLYHDLPNSVPPTLTWDAFDGPASVRLDFFEIDEAGQCEPTRAHFETVPMEGCTTFVCRKSFEADVFDPRNPTGYCWEATAVAENGRESPTSARRRFVYGLSRVQKVSPGVQIAFVRDNPSSLGKFSYGSDVVFDWEPVPGAHSYTLKIGRSPWNVLSPIDPANCLFVVSPGAPPDQQSFCNSGPSEVSYRNTVTGPMTTVRGDFAAKGRYCWVVWPEMEDPTRPGFLSERKPLVGIFPHFCYTSGPAEPEEPEFDEPLPTVFSAEPITGRVRFPFVPDRQFDIAGSPPADFQFSFDDCQLEPNAATFSDFYDCVVEFSITPQEQENYRIVARTWASNAHPPVMNASTLAHEKVTSFVMPGCGAQGEACCRNDVCDANLLCQNDRCVPCGRSGQACCASADPCERIVCHSPGCESATMLSCQGGMCTSCGRVGEVCCPIGGTVDRLSVCGASGIIRNDAGSGFPAADCIGGHCSACGRPGERCCNVGLPSGGTACQANSTCTQGTCTSTGGGGGGGAIPGQCNAMVHAGGDDPETHEIEMGRSSGTVVLTFNTFDVPDNIAIFYENNLLVPTGCFGSEELPAGCFDPPFNNHCCNGAGVCQMRFSYSGSSTKLTVHVAPNCAGTTSTGWEFMLSCPL